MIVHHTGIVVENIKESIVIYVELGYELISDIIYDYIKNFKKLRIGKVFTEKIKAPAFNGRNIVFCYLKNGNILEILQKGDETHDK